MPVPQPRKQVYARGVPAAADRAGDPDVPRTGLRHQQPALRVVQRATQVQIPRGEAPELRHPMPEHQRQRLSQDPLAYSNLLHGAIAAGACHLLLDDGQHPITTVHRR